MVHILLKCLIYDKYICGIEGYSNFGLFNKKYGEYDIPDETSMLFSNALWKKF